MKKLLFICAAAFILAFTGCGKEETDETPRTDTSFGAEKGIAAGIADFSEDEPEISIKNIVTYVGEEIDYSSGIEVSNTERYEDFQMWVDASAVDIHTIGSYEAVYRFIYGDNQKEVKVVVSVIENPNGADEPSGASIAMGNSNNGSNNAENNGSGSNDGNNSNAGNVNGSGSAGGENANGGNNAEGSNGNNNGGSSSGNGNGENAASNNGSANGNNSGNSNNAGNGGCSSNGGSASGNNGSSNGSNAGGSGGRNNSGNSGQSSTAQTTTARRQIVTSTGVSSTKSYSLGYMNIELLSGTTVKIKCTSSKYIVSTHTDKSQTTKNGVNYNVYKLIVRYNTGAEQVLETYEEKIN